MILKIEWLLNLSLNIEIKRYHAKYFLSPSNFLYKLQHISITQIINKKHYFIVETRRNKFPNSLLITFFALQQKNIPSFYKIRTTWLTSDTLPSKKIPLIIRRIIYIVPRHVNNKTERVTITSLDSVAIFSKKREANDKEGIRNKNDGIDSNAY